MPNSPEQRPEARIDRIIFDPASWFTSPEQLLGDGSLTTEQKVAALRGWAYDAAEIDVAVEEGMRGGADDLQRRILIALATMGGTVDVERVGPSKQHGLPLK